MNTAILNVLLQFVEGLISFEFYESIAPTKKKLRNFIIITVGYMVMCAINLAFDYNVIVNIVAFGIFHFIFNFVLYNNKTIPSLIYTFILLTVVFFSEVMVCGIISLFTQEGFYFFLNNPFLYLIVITVSKSTMFFILKLISNIIIKTVKKQKISFLLFLFPAILLIICGIFLIISFSLELSYTLKILLSVLCVVMLLVVIGSCMVQQRETQRDEELSELRAIKQAQETENKYFEILERQNNNLRVYAHDTKNHLQAIRNMTDDENIIEYLERLTADLNKYSRQASSGNHNLDVIINKYITECEIKGVSFDYDIRLSNLSGIQMFDLVSILGNLLDNALESAEKTEKKSIRLQTDHRNTYDVIVITNSCDVKPLAHGDNLKSSKANKKQHGLGIKSIKSALVNYDGDYNWEYDEENKEFISTVMILRK